MLQKIPQRQPGMPKQPDTRNQSDRPHPLWDWRPALMTLFLVLVYYSLTSQEVKRPESIDYSAFKQAVSAGKVATVTLTGLRVDGRYHDSTAAAPHADFTTRLPSIGDNQLLSLLESQSVALKVRDEAPPGWLSILVTLIPWVVIFGFLAWSNHVFQKKMGGAGSGPFGAAKSTARQIRQQDISIRFDDVAGLENAKADLQEVIEFLLAPERFRRLGASLPRGMLMMGPPGTGKTLLARATAAEAGVPFYSISGSEFVEMFVGVGASRVRAMFKEARSQAPALIFIDEIDSVGRVRGTGLGHGNDEREQTLNQILAEMDGFSSDDPVIVLAATNRPDVLDPALLRPGRFDRKVTLELPQRHAREQILAVHARGKPIADEVSLALWAGRTIGFSGAELKNLVNEAALHAARARRETITAEDFEYAHDKVLLGSEREELLGAADRRRIAFHECGHAILSLLLDHTDPLTKVTIIPRGRSLGVTETLPSEDRLNYTEGYLRDQLTMLLGGRCAERIVFAEVSSGAADDLKRATQLARRMVAQFGMSEAIGPVYLAQSEDHPFLGMEITTTKPFSEDTARQVDMAVAALIKECETHALEVLTAHRPALDQLATQLLQAETLDAEQARQVLSDEP